MPDMKFLPHSVPVKYPRQFLSMPRAAQDMVLQACAVRQSTPDIAQWALTRITHTSLRPARSEDAAWIARMAAEAKGPMPLQGMTVWGDTDKITAAAAALKDAPHIALTAAVSYPHGDLTPEKTAAEIVRVRAAAGGGKNPLGIVMAMDYRAWIVGDEAKARDKIETARMAATSEGMMLTVALKANMHAALAQNPHESLYRAARMALRIGADAVQTCTGLAAAPPYTDDVGQDMTTLENAVPVLLALREFNKNNKTDRAAVFAFGMENEIDAARIHFLTQKILGPAALDSVVIGAEETFRRRLMQYIHEERGPKSGYTRADFGPQQRRHS